MTRIERQMDADIRAHDGIRQGAINLTARSVILLRDARSSREIMPHLLKDLGLDNMNEQAATAALEYAFMNKMIDGLSADVQRVLKPYRSAMIKALKAIKPTAEDTWETVANQVTL
jgi:hypothetical protein